jgi:hypothetical protein
MTSNVRFSLVLRLSSTGLVPLPERLLRRIIIFFVANAPAAFYGKRFFGLSSLRVQYLRWRGGTENTISTFFYLPGAPPTRTNFSSTHLRVRFPSTRHSWVFASPARVNQGHLLVNNEIRTLAMYVTCKVFVYATTPKGRHQIKRLTHNPKWGKIMEDEVSGSKSELKKLNQKTTDRSEFRGPTERQTKGRSHNCYNLERVASFAYHLFLVS